MLELAGSLPPRFSSIFVSFSERGLCQDFLSEVRRRGFETVRLKSDMPRLVAAFSELVGLLRSLNADVLCCHGYKANLLGLLAARWLGIPVVSVSRGWTGESLRVRLYETLDRFVLGRMDRVVCVSQRQAEKVRRAGVAVDKTVVIRNAIRMHRFAEPQAAYRRRLEDLFPGSRKWIVGAAGRLSPEKGFDVLVDAAAEVIRADSSAGFVLFGDGPLRQVMRSCVRQNRILTIAPVKHPALAPVCAMCLTTRPTGLPSKAMPAMIQPKCSTSSS